MRVRAAGQALALADWPRNGRLAFATMCLARVLLRKGRMNRHEEARAPGGMSSHHPPILPQRAKSGVTLVSDLMTDVVETLAIGDSLELATRLMKLGRIRHLPVLDGQERLVGLITHRNLLRAWISHGRPNRERPAEIAAEIPVEMLMERNVLTVSPDTSAALAAALLEGSKYGCLPVVSEGKVVGILTEADFVAFARRYFEKEVS
jgi:CBS domain-containing membrane protein